MLKNALVSAVMVEPAAAATIFAENGSMALGGWREMEG